MKPVINLIFFIGSLLLVSCNGKMSPESSVLNRQPEIYPDYRGVTIPANIAPLNFVIQEKADKYFVEIASENGGVLSLCQSSPVICIPQRKWKKLLQKNAGQVLKVSVGIKSQGKWQRFIPITDTIAREPIDGYLAYRLLTGYIYWRDMKIAQRNLENFRETYIYRNSSTDMACANCHSFCNNDHRKMSLHIRRRHGGTIIADGRNVKKVNTKTPQTISAGSYTSWHPNGRLIAYSTNKLGLDYASFPGRSIIVSDSISDLTLYDVERNMIIPCPSLATKNRENIPNWSPDGKWLYFICAGPCVSIFDDFNLRYSLCRVPFDEGSLTFGKVDTLIDADDVRQSISFPRVSPDGKYILFCMTEYGYFTVFDRKSNLYFYEIATGKYWPLACNSESADSFHSWSRNSRWFVFSSKRMDNFYTRPFFAYVDTAGRVHKPFVMPQADPEKYLTYMVNYNLPELVDGKVLVSEQKMRDAVLENAQEVGYDKTKAIDAMSGATIADATP